MSNRANRGKGGLFGADFPDPFNDYSSQHIPTTMHDALRWAEMIVARDGVYWSAIKRVVSYFVTDVEVLGVEREEKKKWEEFLHDSLGIRTILNSIGYEYFTYNNSFPTFVVPFRRSLSCGQSDCRYEFPMSRVADDPSIRFKSSRKFDFSGVCPRCRRSTAFDYVDRRSDREEDLRVVLRSPKEIQIEWDPHTDQTSYIWQIPEYYRDMLLNRHAKPGEVLPTFQLERAPKEVLEAVSKRQDFIFDPNYIFHVKDRTLSGILNRGWGIPQPLTNARLAWYVQVLRRLNEAIALDYVVPVRILTPEASGQGEMGDPLLTSNLGGLNNQLSSIVDAHRKDPASWHFFPFPVKYQMLGGEANRLAPFQLIELGHDQLLNAVGVPVEFYKGSLSLQNTPTAARLFESYHAQLQHHLNRFLNWLVDRIAETLNWPKVTARLVRPSHFDDVNRQLAKLQLAAQGLISQTTGLKAIGVDFKEEQKSMVDEQLTVSELSQEAQEKLQNTQLGGMMATGQMQPGMPPGGDPMAAGAAPPPGAAGATPVPGAMADPIAALMSKLPDPNQPMTAQEMYGLSTDLANELWAMPEPQRRSALSQIRQKNPSIQPVIVDQLEQIRRQARLNGEALAQQAQGGAAPPPAGGGAPPPAPPMM